MKTIPTAYAKHGQARTRDWYRIENKTGDESTADVYVYDEIGGGWFYSGVDAQQFVRDLADLDVDRINLYVNSPGGVVWDGIAMLNAIRRHPANVVATVDGIAASAASFLILGADEVVMGRNSQLMIHDASGGCWGTAKDMADTSAILDKLSGTIAAVYAERAGGDVNDWRDAMLAETWYTAEEAVAAGLADRVDGAKTTDATNSFDLTAFQHAGRQDAPTPLIPTNTGRGPRARGRVDDLIASAYAAIQSLQTSPAEPAATTTHTSTEGDDTMSDTLTQGLRDRLGIKPEANLDENGLLAALDEALAEQATEQPTNATQAPGTVAVDAAMLEQLQRDAADGREARNQQRADQRNRLVDAAVNDGRIPPARREAWLNQLEADPGAAAVLAQLKPVVNLEPAGFTGGVDEAGDTDDNLYNKAWPTAGAATTKED